MIKRYKFWNILKVQINQKNNNKKIFKIGQIWWCHIGLNVGSEENGKNENFERPVFILKKFNHTMFLGVPCSTQVRDPKHYFRIQNSMDGFNLNFSQIRVFSSKRLIRMITHVSKNTFYDILSFFKKYI
jgi:mRNA-degrading endonuclease toxin of MazEF toxin-antitoxin module